MTIRFYITTLFIFFLFPLIGQNDFVLPPKSSPTTAIKDLGDGILIVRLTSEYRKIKELNRLFYEGDIIRENKANLPDRIKRIEAERDQENRLWMKHFKSEYTFSDVYFAYDTLRKEALHGNGGKNCFLNENFEIDSSLSLKGRKFLMLYKGTTVDSGAEAVIFRDASFQQLSKPFPYYVKTTGFMYVFNKVFKSSIADDRNIERIVKKINKKLDDFYFRRS